MGILVLIAKFLLVCLFGEVVTFSLIVVNNIHRYQGCCGLFFLPEVNPDVISFYFAFIEVVIDFEWFRIIG